MGAKVQGHLARNQPHEGSSKGPSSSLHGRPGTTDRIPIHGQGAALSSSGKVQNAANRDVRWNKRPYRPSQYIKKSDGTARISRPRTMQSLRYHTKGPSTGLVKQTFAIFHLFIHKAFYRIRLSLYRSKNVQEPELSPSDHKTELSRKPEVICSKV